MGKFLDIYDVVAGNPVAEQDLQNLLDYQDALVRAEERIAELEREVEDLSAERNPGHISQSTLVEVEKTLNETEGALSRRDKLVAAQALSDAASDFNHEAHILDAEGRQEGAGIAQSVAVDLESKANSLRREAEGVE